MTAPAPLPYRLSVARRPGERDDGPIWVALHGGEQRAEELLGFVAGLGPARELIAPVGCWGTYVGAMDLSSYTWFHEVPGLRAPEPVSLGRSLFDVEQLVLSVSSEAGSAPVVLFGDGQGATLALALAAVLPDLLAAAIAVGGHPVSLPAGAVSAPEAPPPPAIWLAGGEDRAAAEADGTLAELASRTALTVEPPPEGPPLDEAVQERLAAWVGEATELGSRA